MNYIHDKLVTVLSRLCHRTATGSQVWINERLPVFDPMFVTQVGKGEVAVHRAVDSDTELDTIEALVRRPNGKVVDSVVANSGGQTGDERELYELLDELWRRARASVEGADDLLDEMLDELNS